MKRVKTIRMLMAGFAMAAAGLAGAAEPTGAAPHAAVAAETSLPARLRETPLYAMTGAVAEVAPFKTKGKPALPRVEVRVAPRPFGARPTAVRLRARADLPDLAAGWARPALHRPAMMERPRYSTEAATVEAFRPPPAPLRFRAGPMAPATALMTPPSASPTGASVLPKIEPTTRPTEILPPAEGGSEEAPRSVAAPDEDAPVRLPSLPAPRPATTQPGA